MRWSSRTRDCVATFPRFRDEVICLSLSFSVRTWNLIVNEIVFPWEITMEKARNWFSNFPHTQNKTRQGKPNKTKQFTSNMKYELGAFVRELIEVLLPLLLVLHVTCEQLKLRKLRVGILDCLWVGYLLGSSFNSIWHSITCMADDSLNPPRDRLLNRLSGGHENTLYWRAYAEWGVSEQQRQRNWQQHAAVTGWIWA